MNIGLQYASCSEFSGGKKLHVFSTAKPGGVGGWACYPPPKLPTACLRCHPPNTALSGHPPSAWSQSLFNSADFTRLEEAFVLWGLPKILTVLGRDSTLIWGTFSLSFPGRQLP